MDTTQKKYRQPVRLADLKNEFPVPLTTAHEEDRFHQKPSEENLAYWTEELRKADDTDEQRIRECDATRREILLRIVPQAHDGTGEILGAVLTGFDMLPRTH